MSAPDAVDTPGTPSAPDALDAPGNVLDRVAVRGIRAFGHHGVLDSERRDGQEFLVDVVLHLDTLPAARTDDLALTVDYGAVAAAVADVVRGPAVCLVETLAEAIARRCLEYGRVDVVDVVVHKPAAPLPEPFEDVTVSVRRRRTPARTVSGEAAGEASGEAAGEARQPGGGRGGTGGDVTGDEGNPGEERSVTATRSAG